MSEAYLITGSSELKGTVQVAGSKNAALYAVVASLLTSDEVVLHNVPNIADIEELSDILRSLGTLVRRENHSLILRSENITSTKPPSELVQKLRASFLVVGALLGREGSAECAAPGGDVIGSRPLDIHLAGFRALGAEIEHDETNWIVSSSSPLSGASIFFDYPSVLATVNVLLASVLANGVTIIVNAAAEPEVEMVANMLNRMGANISGQGTAHIKISGVDKLHGCDFTIIPDRLEAGTLLLSAIATRGEVLIPNAVPAHLSSLTSKLLEMGADVQTGGHSDDGSSGIRVSGATKLQSVALQAVPYPGFATDLHPPMASALTQVTGVSFIHERVYDNRTLYVSELRKMGAQITLGSSSSVLIEGPSPLRGTRVRALDIRAGAAVVVAALAAEGTTTLEDIHHLDRGYENLAGTLSSIGAKIERV